MSIGTMSHVLQEEDEKFRFDSYYVSPGQCKLNCMQAKFVYNIYNFVSGNFQVKRAQECRIFSFRSIQNLEEGIFEFAAINDACVKVP
jgi:hypothetical protein